MSQSSRLSLVLVLLSLGSASSVACSLGITPPEQEQGGGQKGEDATSSGQKQGSTSGSNRGSAEAQGPEAEGVTCDASTEGVAWCDTETDILFCSDGAWWRLDCTAIELDAYCGYDVDANVVDCYVDVGGECLDDDEACESDDDCCGGLCAEDGYCGEPTGECVDDDGACESDDDCCGGLCAEDGYCGEATEECLDVDYECDVDDDCCSGECEVDGYCN